MNPQLTQQRAQTCLGDGLVKGVVVGISSNATSPPTVALATLDSSIVHGITQAASNGGVVPVGLPGSQGEMLLAGTVAIGDKLTFNSSGKGLKSLAGQRVVAEALEAGVSGGLIAVEILADQSGAGLISREIKFPLLSAASWSMGTTLQSGVTLPARSLISKAYFWPRDADSASTGPGFTIKVGSTTFLDEADMLAANWGPITSSYGNMGAEVSGEITLVVKNTPAPFDNGVGDVEFYVWIEYAVMN